MNSKKEATKQEFRRIENSALNRHMNWKFYIPHKWVEETALWEDVYLLPDDKTYKGKSIWLTVDALGDPSNPNDLTTEEDVQYALGKLGDSDFFIDGTDMIVRTKYFSKHELLDWVRVWLKENELPVDELVEASREEFKGTNQHISFTETLNLWLDDASARRN